jgi:hypothetical protein
MGARRQKHADIGRIKQNPGAVWLILKRQATWPEKRGRDGTGNELTGLRPDAVSADDKRGHSKPVGRLSQCVEIRLDALAKMQMAAGLARPRQAAWPEGRRDA